VSLVQEEHGLRIFENRVRRKLFGPKSEGVTGDCWKLNNEEFHDLYFIMKYYSGDKIKNERGGACVMYGGEERYIKGFGGGNLRAKSHLEDLGVVGRIIL
jgi:hypothetical protein